MTSLFEREWIQREGRSPWLTIPQSHLNKHALIVGSPGSGKTETMLRLAGMVRRYWNWQVIYLDLKGDGPTQERFGAAMSVIPGTRVRTFPASHYDGWRGNANAIFNRLLGIQDYSEPYYKNVAIKLLRLAINAPTGVPRSSKELLANLDLDTLRAIYATRPEINQLNMDARLASGVVDRYWAFFEALDGKLDGDLAYDDADAIYLRIPGLALREEAKSLGRFLVEDFVNYIPERKPTDRMTLFMIDEISTLDLNEETIGSFEKARGFGASVIASAQTYEGLGKHRARIAGSSHLLLLHRCPDPEALVARAGTIQDVTASWGVELGGASGRGQMNLRPRPRVDANEVRALDAGELFVICQNEAQKVSVAPLIVPPEHLERARQALNLEEQRRLYLERKREAKRTRSQAGNAQEPKASPPPAEEEASHSADQATAQGQPLTDEGPEVI